MFAGKRDPFELTKHSSSFHHVRALAVLRPLMHCAQPSTDRWRVSIFSRGKAARGALQMMRRRESAPEDTDRAGTLVEVRAEEAACRRNGRI